MSGKLWLALWPNNDIVLARAKSREEFVEMLDEAADPGKAKITEWKGPFLMEFAAKLPGSAVSDKAYLRPSGPPPPPDAFREALWAAQQAGQGCDVSLTAANGESRRGHRLVLAAACPALAERMGDGGAEVALAAAPNGAALDALLQWLYTQKASFRGVSARQVLPLALDLGLELLAEECDSSIAVHWRELAHFGAAAMFGGEPQFPTCLLDVAAVADRHGRRRLLTYTLQQMPQGQWRLLQGLPAFTALPAALQQLLKAAANRDPPLVHRAAGARTFGISAAAYRAAGGQLSPQEAQALADYEAVHGPAPAPAAVRPAGRAPKRGRAGQAAAPPAPAPAPAQQVYEVTPEQAAASSLFTHGRLELVLAADPPYYDALRFREGLAAFAFPAIAAELKRRDEDEAEDDQDKAAMDRALVAAVQADVAATRQREDERDDTSAALVVAAERGDRKAAHMLMLDVTVPGVFPGLL